MSNRTRGGARTGAGRPPKPASDRARRSCGYRPAR